MTSDKLTASYLQKAQARLKALDFLHNEKAYSDVVREAQECVELLLKALLRHMGLEVPKIHDVSRYLEENRAGLPAVIRDNLDEITAISRSLRKDRELSFYGTEDWIPTDEYREKDSDEARTKARRIYDFVTRGLAIISKIK